MMPNDMRRSIRNSPDLIRWSVDADALHYDITLQLNISWLYIYTSAWGIYTMCISSDGHDFYPKEAIHTSKENTELYTW